MNSFSSPVEQIRTEGKIAYRIGVAMWCLNAVLGFVQTPTDKWMPWLFIAVGFAGICYGRLSSLVADAIENIANSQSCDSNHVTRPQVDESLTPSSPV